MLTLDKVFDASNVLKEVIRPTACIHAPKVNPDCDVYLKTENLQVTGSFKVRGAYYKISQLSDEEKSHGVIACSAGNHAQGVALAATKNGIKSIICLPDGAPISKVEATKGYGAEVCLVPGVYDDAYAKAIELRDANGYTFIHPFDDENVIAGQGTIGLEILSQVADADVIVVPVGGGGLIVDNVADGRGKAVHDLVAKIGGAGGDGGVVAQEGRLHRAAHARGDDGIGRAVDGVGKAVYQIVPQIVENAKIFKVCQRNPDILDIGEVLFEPPGDEQVGADVEEDRHAEIQHIVGVPHRHGDLGQRGKDVAAEVDLGAAVALLGAGVHQAAGYQKITAQR